MLPQTLPTLHAQTLLVHPAPEAHVIPQPPQLDGSLVTFTQRLPQSTVLAGQLHVPAWQVLPPAQMIPHCPQLLESVFLSTHSLLQAVLILPVQTHELPVQVAVAAQACPQEPQFVLELGTQLPPQESWPFGQPASATPPSV